MHVIVIGGGISGLAAAHRLVGAGTRVTLLEASQRLGGKLRVGSVAGTAVDQGAESLLARRPEAVELAEAVGLGPSLVAPAVAGGALWTGGAVRPMPTGHLMGVPGDPDALGEVLSAEGRARLAREPELPPTALGEDVAVGALVAERLGREVVDRLVEPLLGGVYAGDAYRISLRAAVPQLYEAARSEPSLLAAVRAVQQRAAAARVPGAPVFLGIEGGVGRLPGAVADAVRAGGGEIVLGAAATGLRRTAHGWQVTTRERVLDADAVLVSAPAPAAAGLLDAVAPSAAAELRTVAYASMALCTLVFRRADLDRLPGGSGFLVPPVEGRTIKAATFAGNKWRWVAEQDPELFTVRTSVGRIGEEAVLERTDAELLDASRRDLAAAVGLDAVPVGTAVTRWDAGLPQYPVGHLDRVARIRSVVHEVPGLAVCGAAFDGVGVPACVGDARRAAERILAEADPGGDGAGAGARMGA